MRVMWMIRTASNMDRMKPLPFLAFSAFRAPCDPIHRIHQHRWAACSYTTMKQRSRTCLSFACVLAAIFLAHCGSFARAAEPGDAKPNFLFITWEDVSPRFGCYGDSLAHTPAVDRLAAHGLRYDRAFAIAGVCAPSRSAIMSGRWPISLGSHHMRSNVKLPPGLRCFPAYLRDAGYYCFNAGKTDYNFAAPEGSWDVSQKGANWKGRKPGQPFLGVYNFVESHQGPSQNEARAAAQRKRLPTEIVVKPDQVQVPPYYPDTPAVRQQIANVYNNIALTDVLTVRLLDRLRADGLEDDTIIILYGDHGDGIPRVKGHLYHESLRVPLVVKIPERFRYEGLPANGSAIERLVSLMDLGPTILSLAGIAPPADMDGRAFLGEHATPAPRFQYAHRDRINSAYNFQRAVYDGRWHYIRNFRPDLAPHPPIRGHEQAPALVDARTAFRTGTLSGSAATWLADQGEPEALYDTQRDPHCVNNLTASPEHQGVLKEMRAALRDWQIREHDLGFLPESLMIRRARQAGYPARLYSKSDAGFIRLYDLAVAWQDGESGYGRLVDNLNAGDSVYRYWAVLGLGSVDEAPSQAVKLLEERLADEDGAVARAAVWSLHRLGATSPRSLEVLRKVLQRGNYAERLEAIQIARRLGSAAASLKPELDHLSNVKTSNYYDGYLPSAAGFALEAIEPR